MFGFNNYGHSFWPFEAPDQIDLLYIEQTVKNVRGREIRKLVYSLFLLGIITAFYIFIQSVTEFVYSGFIMLIVVLSFCIAALFAFRIYYFRGVPEEYGIIKGTVIDSQVRLVYAGRNRPRAREYVDVLCKDGIMCNHVEVLTAGSEFTSYSHYVNKFQSGDSVNIIKINANVIYAVK